MSAHRLPSTAPSTLQETADAASALSHAAASALSDAALVVTHTAQLWLAAF